MVTEDKNQKVPTFFFETLVGFLWITVGIEQARYELQSI